MSEIASSGNGRQLAEVDRFQIAAARRADLQPAILPLFVRRGGDERRAVFVTVNARVGRQLPGARTERAAQRPMPAHHFGHGGPRSAGGAVAARPVAQRRLQRVVRRSARTAAVAAEWMNGLTASSATSQTRSGARPRCVAPTRIAAWSRFRDADSSDPTSMLPLSTASRICVGRVRRAAGGERVAEAEKRRFQRRHGQAESVRPRTRAPHARAWPPGIWGASRAEAALGPRASSRDRRRSRRVAAAARPPGRGRAGAAARRLPAALGRFEQIGRCEGRNGHVRHLELYNVGMINVSETAASKINELLSEENKDGSGLRVFVQGGGCSGFQYGLMIEENGQGSGDQVFESHGVKLFVDPISIRYLTGAEVDFVDTDHGRRLHDQEPARDVNLRLRAIVLSRLTT